MKWKDDGTIIDSFRSNAQIADKFNTRWQRKIEIWTEKFFWSIFFLEKLKKENNWRQTILNVFFLMFSFFSHHFRSISTVCLLAFRWIFHESIHMNHHQYCCSFRVSIFRLTLPLTLFFYRWFVRVWLFVCSLSCLYIFSVLFFVAYMCISQNSTLRPSPPTHPTSQQSPHPQPPSSHNQLMSGQVQVSFWLVFGCR